MHRTNLKRWRVCAIVGLLFASTGVTHSKDDADEEAKPCSAPIPALAKSHTRNWSHI